MATTCLRYAFRLLDTYLRHAQLTPLEPAFKEDRCRQAWTSLARLAPVEAAEALRSCCTGRGCDMTATSGTRGRSGTECISSCRTYPQGLPSHRTSHNPFHFSVVSSSLSRRSAGRLNGPTFCKPCSAYSIGAQQSQPFAGVLIMRSSCMTRISCLDFKLSRATIHACHGHYLDILFTCHPCTQCCIHWARTCPPQEKTWWRPQAWGCASSVQQCWHGASGPNSPQWQGERSPVAVAARTPMPKELYDVK